MFLFSFPALFPSSPTTPDIVCFRWEPKWPEQRISKSWRNSELCIWRNNIGLAKTWSSDFGYSFYHPFPPFFKIFSFSKTKSKHPLKLVISGQRQPFPPGLWVFVSVHPISNLSVMYYAMSKAHDGFSLFSFSLSSVGSRNGLSGPVLRCTSGLFVSTCLSTALSGRSSDKLC